MSLYPSLEDLKVDQYAKAQEAATVDAARVLTGQPIQKPSAGMYSGLGLEELVEYGGLDISEGSIVRHMGMEVAEQMKTERLAVVTKSNDAGIVRAQIQQGVRELVLAKDQLGKLGIAVKSIDKGIFVAFVWQGSCAAQVGLRFGDQILQIDGEFVAGWKTDKAMTALKKAQEQRVSLVVRDRPFERTVTLVKDHLNHAGFLFKNGDITALVKDSSAARNGLLINHNIIEVNGQNVVAMKDEEIQRILSESPQSVTLTIMPNFIFSHLIKGIGFSSLKKYMDHSIPEL